MTRALPCLDVGDDDSQFAKSEAIMLVLTAYFSATLFFALLIFLVYNIVQFLIR